MAIQLFYAIVRDKVPFPLGVETNEQEYILALRYKQYLRDIPQQETFPFEEVIDFDNWRLL